MSCYTSAKKLVQSCADKLEKVGKTYGILRSVDATESSHWLIDMAIEMRKACEEDVGIPGWHDWLKTLLLKYGYAVSDENTTESDLRMRRFVELAYGDLDDELDAIPTAVCWEQWALELMDQYSICEKEALEEPFDIDEAQEALATCFKDYEVQIEQLQQRVKELELQLSKDNAAGPVFTEDKE